MNAIVGHGEWGHCSRVRVNRRVGDRGPGCQIFGREFKNKTIDTDFVGVVGLVKPHFKRS